MKKIITRRKFFIATAGAGTSAFTLPVFFWKLYAKIWKWDHSFNYYKPH